MCLRTLCSDNQIIAELLQFSLPPPPPPPSHAPSKATGSTATHPSPQPSVEKEPEGTLLQQTSKWSPGRADDFEICILGNSFWGPGMNLNLLLIATGFHKRLWEGGGCISSKSTSQDLSGWVPEFPSPTVNRRLLLAKHRGIEARDCWRLLSGEAHCH